MSEYHARCVDDIFNGTFLMKGAIFYYRFAIGIRR